MNKEEKYMTYALSYARKAFSKKEVPVGAIITLNDKIIAHGINNRQKSNDVTSHAEINAIRMAGKKLKDWRLNDAILYVTLFPCPMCAAAIVQSRIKKIVIGSSTNDLNNKKIVDDIFNNSRIEVVYDIFSEQCSEILKMFFKNQRENE